jgi:tRNA A-37 threonylcarbamoyl transferase component Bud32
MKIATAIFDLHDNGFVHRDIQWRNILFDEKNKIFILIDFEHSGKINEHPYITVDYDERRKEDIEIYGYTCEDDWYFLQNFLPI